jgi:microsomal dipeptidase-like Zn-dependent dipeptidase
VVLYTDVERTCPDVRNLREHHLVEIAKRGGIIGVGYFKTAVCGRSVQHIARALRAVAEVAGIEHEDLFALI